MHRPSCIDVLQASQLGVLDGLALLDCYFALAGSPNKRASHLIVSGPSFRREVSTQNCSLAMRDCAGRGIGCCWRNHSLLFHTLTHAPMCIVVVYCSCGTWYTCSKCGNEHMHIHTSGPLVIAWAVSHCYTY